MGRGILSDSLRDVVLSKSQFDLNYGLHGGSLLQIGLWLSYAWRFLAACILPGICGRGQCVITNTSFLIPTFKCVCDPGYENVLNLTAGFCVNECELEGSCENLGITIPGFTPSSSGSPGSPGTPASNQNATTPSTGCRYALLGGNVLSTGVVVLTTCVYFALFWVSMQA
jgi:hypothetical protein